MRGLLLFLAGAFAAAEAPGQIYRSVDERGGIVYSDQARPGSVRIDLRATRAALTPVRARVLPAAPPAAAYPGTVDRATVDQVAGTLGRNDCTPRRHDCRVDIARAPEPTLLAP